MSNVHIFGGEKKDTPSKNPYGIPTTDDNIGAPVVSLNILYESLPATEGCENCLSCHSEKDWCCLHINPSMYYVEFLNVWKEVQKWSKEKRLQIILRAIKNYLSNNDSKGCIFYDSKCLVYKSRPLQCRFYGVISEESWNKRSESIKKQYDVENMSEEFRAKLVQCNLVKCKGEDDCISIQNENKWFIHAAKCEARIGVNPKTILEHDGPKGSYRTFHDHIMLEFFENESLNKLTQFKMSMPSDDDIDKFANILVGMLNNE
jgi:Fe-S-cluster containining protein